MSRIDLTIFVLIAQYFASQVLAAEPTFNRDIRPILAAKCFACHGRDEEHREADLRLDVRENAIEQETIVPGKPQQSELVVRIMSDDPDLRMPPAESNETLTDKERETLRTWIAAGANYEEHWAFVAPTRPAVPATPKKFADWPTNGIDHFVLARLQREGLVPSSKADRYALVRRVYLDLNGLPPTPAEADAFFEDHDPKAYERLVDRLLESKHYGERWARQWLDLARYADTNGYEKDRTRSIWPYRDWVIRALNDDMPFNQFTVEQLAGDMLPNATPSQRIATGFHRNTMLNEEGGIDPLEYRFYAMVDRVATTGTVWLGLTTGCVQCHSHKYDPISHTDYYSLMALLDNADEPDFLVPDPAIAKRRETISKQIAELEADLPNQFPADKKLDERFEAWVESERGRAVRWTTLRPSEMTTNLPRLELLDDGSIFSTGDVTKRDVFKLRIPVDEKLKRLTAIRLEVLPDDRLPAGGPGRAYYEGRKGDFFLSEFTARADGDPVKFATASHTYGKIAVGSGNANATNVLDGEGSTGWSTAGREGESHQLVINVSTPVDATMLEIKMLFERHFVASLGRFRLSATTATEKPVAKSTPLEMEALLADDPASWTEDQRAQVLRHYLTVAPELADARKRIDQLRKQLPTYPTTMVMLERPADNPRPTHRHHRGEYLSPREKVAPALPSLFNQEDGPTNRLSLARWLASEKNPLVARVTVNRAWQALFGNGLVRASGDFGTQIDPPTHPDLLDWLACEFIEQGWSMKKLHRLIVTSATYRQSSRITPTLARDSANELLARGPRHRIDAEIVRDTMLKASGLLSPRMFGPSVYPPQPASVTSLAYGGAKWTPSTGENRYRRSLYTFSKRTAPFAAFTVFDATSGENCTAKRNRSNTPLQALTLLNDEMFLEFSRALATNVLVQKPQTSGECATMIFRRLLTRKPDQEELTALVEFFDAQRKRIEVSELNAVEISHEKKSTPELAAWIMVTRAVMNLDEAITKP